MQSFKLINAGPRILWARESTRASATSPPCTWCVWGRQIRNTRAACMCARVLDAMTAPTDWKKLEEQTRTQREKEKERERNIEILRSSRVRWSRAGLTCVVTHKYTNARKHTHTHTHLQKHTQTHTRTHTNTQTPFAQCDS
jgi:hypothetical protein